MPKEDKIPAYLLYGFAISSIGGPLAFISLYLFSASGPAIGSLGAATIMGVLLFLFPLLIWYNYSRKIASSGGLYEFVKRSSNERVAKIQGWLWLFSYLLYLPYTVTYIVFYLLPAFFSVSQSFLYFLEVALPILISAVMLSGRRLGLMLLLLSALAQILIIVFFLALVSVKTGVSLNALQLNTSPLQLLRGSLGISLLFICSSLLLFLGGEAKDSKKALGKILLISFLVVAILVVLAAILLASSASGQVLQKIAPGFVMANSYSGQTFADAVGLFTLLSLASLIVAEFFALSRLANVMLKVEIPRAMYGISAFFIALDVVSLINPYAFYDYTLVPSLIALYLSQLIPVLAYPFFLKKFYSRVSISDILMVAVASILILYGLSAGFT